MSNSTPKLGAVSKRINTLCPATEYEEIVRTMSFTLFPWDIEKSLEFALFRTYAVPSIAKILAATGEFTERAQKRYDDTAIILAEISEKGINSDSGQKSLTRMNEMHSGFKIKNDDFLYVLSTFIYEPIRWNELYAARPFTELEKQAWFNYYISLGKGMKIEDLPSDLETFEAFNIAYEKEHFCQTESTRIVAAASRDLFLSFILPKPLWGMGKPFVYALLDEPLLKAFDFPKAPAFVRGMSSVLLAVRKSVLGMLPDNTKPKYITTKQHPSYPGGYCIEELGTFRKDRSKPATCPHIPAATNQ